MGIEHFIGGIGGFTTPEKVPESPHRGGKLCIVSNDGNISMCTGENKIFRIKNLL